MTSTMTVSVNAEELRTTFEFVSFGAPLEHSAFHYPRRLFGAGARR
jgi:hypothetical protein